MARTYLRDGRSPTPGSERISAQMSRIRARNTGPEKAMRRILVKTGIRGYRLHYKRVPGRPDLAFVGKKVAVFVHGCFWHCCPYCTPARPKNNRRFWHRKLDRNVERDSAKAEELRSIGWRVITVWACRLHERPLFQAARVHRALLGS
ncbi:MAG: very short patch repair endonuclease [Flavobacteriales bacterium]|nr:very short patch repair endonuclease [Flavobacteriales bacterium]MBK6945101.1 very short patch repair endonuclease [Flavobacteriales bacterium]MBK7239450.1 very short patch repair endonuclease [Flavobacteriales bacterium]MBK7295994.1 very short patch repair endonuclease [Flavobacteriales bacterium]MBK9535342.1 very short patch repair endonuclease [Flavobacteriales bacterium]